MAVLGFASNAQALMIADSIVIGAAYTGSTGSATSEAMILYNPTPNAVSLSGWKLYEAGSLRYTFGAADTIPAFGYYSFDDVLGVFVGSDIDDIGTFAFAYDPWWCSILNPAGDTQDIASGGATAPAYEAAPGPTTSAANKASYRKPATHTNALAPMIDADDNSSDFQVEGPANDNLRSSASATSRLVFSVSAPAAVTEDVAFNLTCTAVAEVGGTTYTDSVITAYTGASAWANVSVPGGFTISLDTTSAFTNGVKTTSFSISGVGSCTITIADAYCTGSVTVDVSSPVTYGGVYWPGAWNGGNPDSATQMITSNMATGYCRKTVAPSVGNWFKVTDGTWNNNANWSAGHWITAYNTTWTMPRNDQGDANNGQIQGAPNTYVTLVSPTAPSATSVKFSFMTTSATPITITDVTDVVQTHTLPVTPDSNVTVGITLSGAKCAEENVYVRWSNDNWTTSNFVLATGAGTAYTATFSTSTTDTVKYYALTTSCTTAPGLLTHADADLLSLSIKDSGGANFAFGVAGQINSWHIPQNNEPAGDSAYMRYVTRSDFVDTMYPRRRTTDNPIGFYLGKYPINTDTPTTTLYYKTPGGGWTAVNSAETTISGANAYFKFLLSQAASDEWDYNDTISYYFKLAHPSWATTYVYGNGTVDNIATSESTVVEATAQGAPFIYRIRSTVPPPPAAAVNPQDAADNVTTRRPTITWTGAADVDTPAGDSIGDYYFEISTNSDMSAPIGAESGWKGSSSTSYTIQNNLTLNQWYYWRVRAKDGVGLISDSSSIFSFRVQSGFRAVDGDPADWSASEPGSYDTSLIKDSEFIWRASDTDARTDGDNPDDNYDLTFLRLTGDVNSMYLLFKMKDITSWLMPWVAVAVDTNRTAASGQQSFGGYAQTKTATAAQWEANLLACSDRTGYFDQSFAFKTRGDGWISEANNVIEQSIPWSELGVTLPATLRFTTLTSQNNLGDAKQQTGWDANNMSRSLDGITTDTRKGGAGWWGEIQTDSVADYYFDVDFDTNGHVVMNSLDVTGAPSSQGTLETFVVTVTVKDYNHNPLTAFTDSPTISHNGVGTLTTVSSTAWESGVRTFTLKHDRQETITITIQDPWSGKSDNFTCAFVAYPEIVISEVAVAYGSGDSDFVELFVKDDRAGGGGLASLGGWKLYTHGAGGSRTLRKTFGSCTVRTNSFVVVWFDATGKTDETNDNDDSRVFVYTSSGNTIMPSTQLLIDIARPNGVAQDVVVYSPVGSLDANIATGLQIFVDSGLWGPDNTFTHTVPNTSIGTAGNSIRRADAMTDDNDSGDWTLDQQTPGNMTLDRFIVSSDSANPTVGESFTLTVYAIDSRNDTIVGARFAPTLSSSSGSIFPTSIKFVADHTDWNSGDTSRAFAILGTSGEVTCTVTSSSGKTGTTTLTVTAPLTAFTVTASDPNLLASSGTVKRGSAFNLRIIATDNFGTTKTDYAGTVTLSVESGTISPASITFNTAWLGDTTCSTTIVGDSAIGKVVITVADGGTIGRDTIVPLSDNRVTINEVLPRDLDDATNDRDEWIELYNRSLEAVSVNAWTVTNYRTSGTPSASLPNVTIPSGRYLVVHTNKTGTNDTDFNDTDGAAHVFPYGSADNRLTGSAGEAGIYNSASLDSSTIASYLAWTSGTGLNDSNAAQAGIWPKGDFISFVAGSASDRSGRTLYRAIDGMDTNLSKTDWSLMALTDTYLFTEGFSNVNTQPDAGGATMTLSTTSSAAGDTFVAGDTIYITLTAASGGNASAVDVTTVYVYSDTDPTGIIVWLEETGNNTLIFQGEAYVATNPLESHDGNRIIVAEPGDSLTISWVKSPLVKQSTASVGALDHFTLTPSASSLGEGTEIQLTIVAKDKGDFTVTSWTETVVLTASSGSVTPGTALILAGGNGETTIAVTFSAGPGAITCTATYGTKTGTCTLTILPDTDYVVNEVLPTTGGIDWDASGGVSVADEWLEIYNKGNISLPLTGYKITHATAGNQITLAGSLPPRGWVTIYRRTSNNAVSYHFDSSGIITDTNAGLTGAWTTSLPNDGGTAQLLDPNDVTIAQLVYPVVAQDQGYGRAVDGSNNTRALVTPSPGTYRTATPNNVSSPNTVFMVNAPATVSLNAGFTLVAALQTRSGDTVTTFGDTATLALDTTGATLAPSTLSFGAGVSTATCTFTAGTNNDSYALHVYTLGAIRGVDTVTLVAVTVNAETSNVSVTQAIADGIDTAIVQVVVLTAAGAPLSGLTVNFSSSKGGADNLSSATAVTNASGVAAITVTSLDTTPSKITVTVDGITLNDSPQIYWLDPGESGVTTSFGTRNLVTSVSGATQFIQFPQWRADGSALGYIAKTAAEDTWNVYVAYDDGTNGDVTPNDGTFSIKRATGAQHMVNPSSKIAFADILSDTGGWLGTGGAGDGVVDVIFSAFDSSVNNSNLYAVRANGSDNAIAKSSTVKLTVGGGIWSMPAIVPDTDAMYAIYQGSVYRLPRKGSTPYTTGGGGDKILEAGTATYFMIDGVQHAVADIVPYNKDVMAVTMINNKTGDPGRNKRSVILILTELDVAGYRHWTSINGTTCKLVNRPDSMIAWNLAWDTGGRALTWARDITGNFNWVMVRTRHYDPKFPYATTNFDVEAIYVTETNATPNRPVSIINNASGFNDLSNAFSPGAGARSAYVSYDAVTGDVKLNVLDIDGVATVNADGGLLFENGLLTAIIDEGDVLSGSIELRVSAPTGGAPANPHADSIALTGKAREFFPHGQQFDDSITVILYYDTDDLNAAEPAITNGTADEYRLKVYWWNGAAWIDYNAVVDPTDRTGAAGKLTFQTNHFSTFGVGYEPIHPNRPNPLAPIDAAEISTPTPTFAWQHNDPQSRPQRRYQIQVSLDAAHTQAVLTEEVESAETTVALIGALPRGESTLYWRARTGATDAGFGAWSNVDSFFATKLRAPLAPTLLAPGANVETRELRPNFQWSFNDPDAEPQARYHLEIASDSSFSSIIVARDAAETTTSFEVDTLAEGSVYWRVRTADAYGFGPWSDPRRLTIDRTPLAPTVLVAPETTTSPSPSFTWIHQHPEGGAQAAYLLELALESSFTAPVRTVTRATSETSVVLTGEDLIDLRGSYRIYFRLRTSVSGSAWGKSATGDFAALLNPPSAPTPLEPADGYETSGWNLTFRWTHLDPDGDSQAGLLLRIARDTSFASPVWADEIASTSNALALALPLSGGAYWWQVATRDAVGFSDWSVARSFLMDTRSIMPLPMTPAQDAIVTTPLATFSWQHRDQSAAPQSAAQLQIALDSSFAAPLRTVSVAGVTATRTLDASDSLLLSVGDHPIFWRIRTASFGTDYGDWAADSSFTLRLSLPETPTLLSPADSYATRDREIELHWSHQHATLEQTSARIQLSRDTNFTAPAEYAANAEDAMAFWFYGGTNYWRIQTAAVTGWSPWSAVRTIEVDTTNFAPALVAPIGGETLSTPTPTFRWSHLDPAANPQSSAKIEIATETSFAAPLVTTTIISSETSYTLAAAESIPLTGIHTLYWRARTASYGTDFGPVSTESSFVAHLNPPLAPLLLAPADTTRLRRPGFSWTHRDSETDPQSAARIQLGRDSTFAATTVDTTIAAAVASWTPAESLTAGAWYWRAATRDAVGWGAFAAPLSFAVDTFPLWRSMIVTTALTVPVGETRTIAIELRDETGAATPWTIEAGFFVNDSWLPSSAFTVAGAGASFVLRFDTAGAYRILLVEDIVSDSATMTALSLAEITSSETYAVVAGSAGDASFLAPTDTQVTTLARIAGADTTLRMKVTLGETVLVAETAPTLVEAGLAYWQNIPITLTPASRITTTITRAGETLVTEIAYILSDPTQSATFTEYETGGLAIVVPANATDSPLWVRVNRTVAASTIAAANSAVRTGGRKFVDSSAVEINGRAAGGATVDSFSRNLTFRLPAAAANGLKIAYLKNGRWVELATTYDSALGGAVTEADHLSVWGLVAGLAFGNSVNEVIVYPNPWRHDGPTGGRSVGDAAYGVKFDRMPAGQVRVRIFTLAGELVLDGSLDPSSLGASASGGNLQVVDVGGATGQVTRWTLRNQGGRDVASGTYIIMLEGPGGRAVRKVAIIR